MKVAFPFALGIAMASCLLSVSVRAATEHSKAIHQCLMGMLYTLTDQHPAAACGIEIRTIFSMS